LHIATTPNAESKSFYNESPKSIGSLTEASRIHFKEMLEFLEALQLPYQINTKLLPNTQYCSHTVFEIRGTIDKTGQEILLASGGRYNYIAKRSGYKKDIPACGITVFYPKKLVAKKKLVDKIRPAKFYLVQLGNLAKLQTLSILEMLRQERINVYHSLTKENIGVQLASAEYLKVSHLLIVGQKEAIENSVVVRSMDLRDQETVAVAELCRHLKQILKK
jgi:histidyl-tRNA synthetase